MKQFMYDDRQYLPVPNVGGLGVGGNPPNLVERLMLGNLRRKNPYDLWFIDRRTRDRHSGVVDQLAGQLASDSKGDRRPGWSFYLPTRDCPADYRELSILFMLHSIHKDPRRRSRKGRPTVHGNSVANSFHGLEKLTGVGKGQACVLAKRLEDLNLIKVVPTEGWPWFHLADPAPFAEWFMPVSFKSSGGVPPEIVALEQECQQAQEARAQRQAEDARAQEAEILKSAVERALAYGRPEQALAMCDQRIPFEIRQKPWLALQWSRRRKVEDPPGAPTYRDEDALLIERARAMMTADPGKEVKGTHETTSGQRGHDGHTKTSVRQDDGDDGGPDFGHDSFLENLRKM